MSNYILFLSEAAEEAVSTTVDPNTITDMAEAIDKFGVGTVLIAAMICYISIFITCILASNRKKSNDLTKMLKEQNENTLKQNMLLLEKITEHQCKEINTEKNLVNIFMKLNNILKDECQDVQTKLDCERVGIYACHNGAKTNMGLPFFKTSCISEWMSAKTMMVSGIAVHNNLQLGIFYSLVKKVFEDGYCVIYNTGNNSSEFENVSVSRYLNMLEIETSIIVPILNSDGLHIGAVSIEYKSKVSDEEAIKKAIENGRKLAHKIAPLLDYSLSGDDFINN